MSMWKPDPEKVLKEAKWRHKEIRNVYYDRPDDGYKFRQKDWMVRRFIGDAKSAGYVLGQLIEAYDELLAEVKQFHNFDEYITMLRHGQIDADDICDVWDEIRLVHGRGDEE